MKKLWQFSLAGLGPAALLAALAFTLARTPARPQPAAPAQQPVVAQAATPFPTSALTLHPLGAYRTGIFDASATEAIAFDAASRRAFVTNAAASTLEILDLSDPAVPQLVASLDVTPWGGDPRSVDAHDGLVAVAVGAERKTDPGTVLLLDVNGTVLAALEVGPLPDMLTFTPDGSKLVVANEGEPNDDYTRDPEGSVSIISLARGVEALSQQDVTTARFGAFNDLPLDPSIRIFGPGATVAQDLEPEYVAVSPDSTTAWVTLQENNALAVIDLVAGRATALLPLGYKDHSRPFVLDLRDYPFAALPVLGQTPAGQELKLGGFSGLWFDGADPESGALIFLTHTDRGPNADGVDVNDDGHEDRPFALPDFQPQVVRLALDPASGTATVLEQMGLTRADGTPLTGLPNLPADDSPVDLLGQPLPYDPLGIDPEAIARAADGSLWLADEYRPSLYHFTAAGALIERYVPQGANDNEQGLLLGKEALPEVLRLYRNNRGFEALVFEGSILYAFMQSPLDNPTSPHEANGKASTLVRIIAFDTVAEETVGEYLYRLEGGEVDKLGDAVGLGNSEFLVLERDDVLGPEAQKFIFRISLAGATNLHGREETLPVGPGQGLELQSVAGLGAAGIRPVHKQLYVDLTAAGYTQADKLEGMALVDGQTIALINDDDFGLIGSFDPATGALDPNPIASPSLLSILTLKPTSLDAGDRDGGYRPVNPPVLGMFQPDGIAAWDAQGETWLVTANEGEARDFNGFSEEIRVEDLLLDLEDFPDAGALLRREALGRLRTTTVGSDINGDGLADRLFAYGARSFSIWDAQGTLVWDSGDDFERITAQLLPAFFNADSAESEADTRSDDKGPEPEAVAVGRVGETTYAFIGMERIGGIFVYDVSNPFAPAFVTYATTRDFGGNPAQDSAGDLAPEGIRFVSAEQSPSGEPLLLVAHETSGSVAVFAVRSAGAIP